MNSTLMHCLPQKSQHLQLLFNEQYMNSNRVFPKRVKKKKKKKRTKTQNADVGSKRRRGSKHTLEGVFGLNLLLLKTENRKLKTL